MHQIFASCSLTSDYHGIRGVLSDNPLKLSLPYASAGCCHSVAVFSQAAEQADLGLHLTVRYYSGTP